MMRTTFLVPLLLALVLGASACGGGSGDSSPTPEGPTGVDEPADNIAIFGGPEFSRALLAAGVDAPDIGAFLLSSSSTGDGQFDPAAVPSTSVRGAKLIGTPRDADFAERLTAAFPDATDVPGAREAYDAVYLVALSALAANSADAETVSAHLLYVANGPGEPVNTGPDGLPRAIGLLSGGADIDLIGASGLLDFATDEAGQSSISKAAAEVWTIINGAYTPLETRDVDLVAEVGAVNPPGAPARSDVGITGPIRIGAITDTSGPDAARGASIVGAMQLAVQEINTLGISSQVVELAVEDDGGDPAAASEASDKLVAEGAIAVIGPTTGGSAVAIAGKGGTKFRPAHLTLSSDPAIAIAANPSIFSTVPLQTAETVILANFARELKLEVACIIAEDGEAGSAMADAFRQAFEAKGGRWRTPIFIGPDDEADYELAISGCFDS